MKKYCQKCGAEFQCMHNQIEVCHCVSVKITDEAKQYLKKSFSDFLCHQCLVEIANQFKSLDNESSSDAL